MLFVLASYQFRMLTLPSTRSAQPSQQISDQDYIDSIIAVAGLTATPQDIDPILDDLRILTSHKEPGRHFTVQEKQQLLGVYSRLEAYFLRDADPLRTFTPEQLHRYVAPAFRTLLSTTPTPQK